mmetsp:Transcript_136950/g.238045  ORF Transcript_136950/g.238045 Transcript_136950/m.238045 type:complete len:769 (-) Transcript_136950:890-3196(-)
MTEAAASWESVAAHSRPLRPLLGTKAAAHSTTGDGLLSPKPPAAMRSRSTPMTVTRLLSPLPAQLTPLQLSKTSTSADFAKLLNSPDELEEKLRRPTSARRTLPTLGQTGNWTVDVSTAALNPPRHVKDFNASMHNARNALQQKMLQLQSQVTNTAAKREARRQIENQPDNSIELANRVQQLEEMVRNRELAHQRGIICREEERDREEAVKQEVFAWERLNGEHQLMLVALSLAALDTEEEVIRNALQKLESDMRDEVYQRHDRQVAVLKQQAMLHVAHQRRQRRDIQDLEDHMRSRLQGEFQAEAMERYFDVLHMQSATFRLVLREEEWKGLQNITSTKQAVERSPEFRHLADEWLAAKHLKQQEALIHDESGSRFCILSASSPLNEELLRYCIRLEEGFSFIELQQAALMANFGGRRKLLVLEEASEVSTLKAEFLIHKLHHEAEVDLSDIRVAEFQSKEAIYRTHLQRCVDGETNLLDCEVQEWIGRCTLETLGYMGVAAAHVHFKQQELLLNEEVTQRGKVDTELMGQMSLVEKELIEAKSNPKLLEAQEAWMVILGNSVQTLFRFYRCRVWRRQERLALKTTVQGVERSQRYDIMTQCRSGQKALMLEYADQLQRLHKKTERRNSDVFYKGPSDGASPSGLTRYFWPEQLAGSISGDSAVQLGIKEYEARSAFEAMEMEARVRLYVYEADEKFSSGDPYEEEEMASVVSGWTRRSNWMVVRDDVPLDQQEDEARATLWEAQQSEWVAITLLFNSALQDHRESR